MSERICVDANIVIRRLDGATHPHIPRRIQSALNDGRQLIAPGLMRYEVTNVLYQSLKTQQVSPPTALALVDALGELPITMHDDVRLHHAALTISSRFRIPAAYDAHYVALAQHLDAEL